MIYQCRWRFTLVRSFLLVAGIFDHGLKNKKSMLWQSNINKKQKNEHSKSIVLLTSSFFRLELKCFYNPSKVLKHTCFPSLERLWTKKKPLHCLRTTFYCSNKLQQNNFQRQKKQSSIERSVYLSKSIKVIQIQLSREAAVRRYSSE